MIASIVMAYHNRIRQLKNTLDSYDFFYSPNDYELIVVNDSPENPDELKKLLQSYESLNYKIHVEDRSHQEFRNPSILYNKAVEMAGAENIIITNPENIHTGDVIDVLRENLTPNRYLVFGCKSGFCPPSFMSFYNDQERYVQRNDPYAPNGWYQHSKYNSRMLHFLSAIKKSDYEKIGGFDPKYDEGISLDDNDFVCKILSEKFEILAFDEPYCLHQAHFRQPYGFVKEKFDINMNYFKSKWGGLEPHEALKKLIGELN